MTANDGQALPALQFSNPSRNRTARRWSAICLILPAALGGPNPFLLGQEHAAPGVLEDFEGAKLSVRWTAAGQIKAQRVDVPEAVKHEGVAGKMVLIEAQRGSVFAVRSDAARPPLERAGQFRFRVRAADASKASPFVFEFRVYSGKRRAWRWRKVSLRDPAWQTIDIPLRYCRPSSGAYLDWSEPYRYGFYFRDAGKIKFDKLELVPGKNAQAAYLSAEELAGIAFGREFDIQRNGRFVVITNEPRLNGQRMLEQLDRLYAMVYRDFPKLPAPKRAVPCLVFSTRGQFREFWPRLAKRFGAEMQPVQAQGFTALGIAASSYSAEQGDVRPVYLQEACHALLAQTLGVANQGEWLQEGLANYYQLHWSKQDIHQLTRASIQQGRIKPFGELLNGKPIGMPNYAQAVLVVKWLLAEDKRRQQFYSAMQEMRQRCSTDLQPISNKCFSQPLQQLQDAWLAWARKQIRPDA